MKAERHKKIINLIKGNGAVKVSVLAKELDVTKETIRSDLNTLAEKRNYKKMPWWCFYRIRDIR